MDTPLILHHYDASPFTQKALRMLGLKRLAWHSVETPMMPPKEDLVALTGGYRGTPVLQVGADVYVDNQMIALELERRFPERTFFPGGNRGIHQALVKWSDAFFRAGLNMVIALQASQWPEPFQADRRQLFPDIDFDTAMTHLPHARAQLRALASLLEDQLADGRAFLAGDLPSLADIHAFSVPWFARAAMPETNGLLGDFTHLLPWEKRVADIGEGKRTPMPAAEALAIARTSVSITEPRADLQDGQGLKAGQRVTVAPEDSRRGAVTGEVVLAGANVIAVRHRNDAVGAVVVHFPRIGYRVTPA